MGSNYTDEVIIDVITVAKGNSVAEVFDTAEALSASLRADGNIAYARDTQDFYFRSPSGWRAVGGSGVVTYDTEEALIADSPADGNIGFANNTDTFYFRQGGAWEPFAVGGGESNIGGTTGVGAAVYKGKSGITLLFRSMIAGSNKLTVTENADTLSLDVVPANIPHQQLAGAGEKTHAEIDSALSEFSDYVANAPEPIAINDADVSAAEVWSSEKVDSELATKLNASALNDASTSTSDVWSAAKITEELAGVGGGDPSPFLQITPEAGGGAFGSAGGVGIKHVAGQYYGLQIAGATGGYDSGLQLVFDNRPGQDSAYFAMQNGENLLLAYNGSDWILTLQGSAHGGRAVFGAPLVVYNGTEPSSPAAGTVYLDNSSSKLRYYDGTDWIDVDTGGGGGGSTFATQVLGPNGSAGAPTFAFEDDPDTGIFRYADNQLGVTTGGQLALWIDPAGSVILNHWLFLAPRASDPAGEAGGQIYYNTSTGKLRYFNGTSWADASGGSVAAEDLTGTALPAAVVDSSLTSVGTLTDLTVTNPIAGSVSGSAGSVAAGSLTGTTLASNVVSSSLTSVGTLASLTVTAPIAGSVTGSSASTTGNAATVTTIPTLSGDVSSSGNAVTVANSAVIGKVLTGFSAAAGAVAATDTVLQGFNKLAGSLAAKADDSAVVHNSGTETVAGAKSFTSLTSMAGVTSTVSGTAALPAFAFTGVDGSRTGMYLHADGTRLMITAKGVTIGELATGSGGLLWTTPRNVLCANSGVAETGAGGGFRVVSGTSSHYTTISHPSTTSGALLFKLPPNIGTSGFVLTTDGAGVLTWVAAVNLTANQTIAGTKTFSSPIAGSVTGSAATALGLGTSSSDPTGSAAGAEYFNTAIGRPKYYDGSAWQIEGNARVVFDFGDATTPLVLAANAPRTVCQASVTGNIVWALPSAVTAGAGCSFTFVNVGGGGGTATVLTNGSEVIFLASSQTTGGGYVVSANAGETITVTALVYGNWVATSQTGTWTAH